MMKFEDYFSQLIKANDLLEAILHNGYSNKVINKLLTDAKENDYVLELYDINKDDSQYVDIYDKLNSYLNTINNLWIEEESHA